MNFYEILEIDRNSSTKEIKKHYYSLSKKYHPDKNPGDSSAESKFRLPVRLEFENVVVIESNSDGLSLLVVT